MEYNKRLRYFLLYCLILIAAFWRVVAALVDLSLSESLNSYVLIIPAISATLLGWQRKPLSTGPCRISTVVIFLLMGVMGLLGAVTLKPSGLELNLDQGLPPLVFAMTSLFIAGFAGFLGAEKFASSFFPLLFLYLMIPLPEWIENPLTVMLQYGSAAIAFIFLKLTIFPMYWENFTVFNLPGITIQVAEECSGIRSTLILMITTVLTSHLMLRSTKARLILILMALPIGILRNAFRIWILALLAVYADPTTLSGPLHHQGGPIFFVLALMLVLLIAYYLRRAEIRAAAGKAPHD